MKALDLAEQVPLVTRATSATDAALVLAENRAAGLVVADDEGVPVAVLGSTQLLRLVLPRYVREDPRLAHVLDEAGADELCARLDGHTVGELLDDRSVPRRPVPSVLPQDTLVEVAALMDAEQAPVVLVRDKGGTVHGVVTLSRLLAALLALGGRTDRGDPA